MSKLALLIICFLVTSCAASSKSFQYNILNKKEYATATINDHFIMCRSISRSACGMRLSQCNTKIKYDCVHDVSIINIDDFDKVFLNR